MSARDSKLSPLLSTHDLKLVCSQCCVREKEITYTLKPVKHQCNRNVLLCKAKGGSKWRPVSKRPAFPNPKQYMACWHFVEGHGCRQHKNRCTFARSDEEAVVWTFERHQGLDHALLCNIILQSERRPHQSNTAEPLGDILEVVDLKAVCDLCSVKENEITYTLQSVVHKCGRTLLLAKGKVSDQWKLVSERPTGGQIGQNVLYKVCNYIGEDFRCRQHTKGQGCTYAKSFEEATVWNYIKEKKLNKTELIRLLTESESIVLTPERAAESILRQFSGEFTEFCKDCFQEHPQKLTSKRWTNTCAADAAHTWDPVLVYHLSENRRKHVYSQVRPLPSNCQFTYCSYVMEGKPCWHTAGHCQSAQSEVEMAVWKAEHTGLYVRPHLLQLSRQKEKQPSKVTMYCKVCLLGLSSPESFYKHCASLDHAQLVAQDTTTKWRGREPPHNRRAELWLCERPQTCEYGSKCPKAHSVEELQEWMMRAEKEKEIVHNIQAQGLMSYNEMLIQEYKNSSNEVYIISELVDDVSISCDEDLTVDCKEINATLKWNFQIETERQLVHVALLKQEPGASFTLDDADSEPCIYSSGEPFLSGDRTYDITVSFTSTNPGLYEQWLVLDFDMRPVLLKKLKVRVGHVSFDDTEQPTVSKGARFQSAERWHSGNRIIIPCSFRTEEQEELLKKYKPPQISLLHKSTHNTQTTLNNENYRERMHHFLYNEELAEDQVVSRINVCGEITTLDTLYSSQFGTKEAPLGQLLCAVPIPRYLTQDSPEGLALQQSIRSALIAPLTFAQSNHKVYEASVLPHKTSENKIFLQLSKQCCSDLALKSNESYQMEVQFQLDRFRYCTMHKAVDRLPDTNIVLPVFKNCVVPVSNISCENLNTKQQLAVQFITGNSSVKKSVAPLLIYGPFGTGKTFTLATAARELCKDPRNKVLLCTHTNSSADLYVREHFHPVIRKKNDGIRPVRIKANKQGTALFATDNITLKYCLLSEDRHRFLPPTKAALDQHNIIITTTTMARHFHDLNLAEGYFTHILIDEASQMLECEALMALGLAGSKTRVVLAGDHMQMGPKLFSVDDYHRSNHTLLTRLFHYYQGQNCDAANNSRIIFNENYRSTKEIVEFVSTYFYVGKNDIIKAAGNVPGPTNCHALKFHHVRGECLLDTVTMSWYNKAEVAEVVQVVKDILQHWPSTWGVRDQSSICILSEGFQVLQIRTALLSRNLPNIHVERLANVQGKQFRAVIITTVQTRDSLKTSHLPGLEMFSDARVLNTAMTRAQSQVVVVGDASALCCFGKCSGIWKSFINHCISSNSVAPQHFTAEFFERDVMETAKFQKSEHVDESHTLSDAILKELTDDYEQLKTDYSSDEDSMEIHTNFLNEPRPLVNVANTDSEVLEICKKQPEIYKQGKMFRESYSKGYVIPFHNPNKRINIKGPKNLGKTFTGDEVLLQGAKVISITKKDESARVLMCLLEDEDHSKKRQNSEDTFIRRRMMPIKRSEPKICIRIHKKTRNFMPIWEKMNREWTITRHEYIDENLRHNSIFMVQVIFWKEECYSPLGYVIDILPVGRSLADGLSILNEEFKVAYNTCTSGRASSWTDENEAKRQDLRELITFTVDPVGAKILDDAISVRELEDHYELGVHIADVASFVRPGDELDRTAEQRGTTYYCAGEKPIHIFPQELSTQCFSLQERQDRGVVSLMFKIEKYANKVIEEPTFQLSLINSDKQLSYEEAEDIISKRYKDTPKFDTFEDCVTVAYCFAKAQRKIRLEQEWAYSQADDDKLPGKRKAHLMIEELSVLFNRYAAETLISCEKTEYSTPLRCQAKPDPEKLEKFKEKCGELIPLSFHVRHKVDHDQQSPKCEYFRILNEVWKEIVEAARTDDTDKMVDLVAADDIHPMLKPVTEKFKRCSSKAYIICSKSSRQAEIGHYSLNLKSYTKASSPLRQYLDLILQRLLHSVICNTDVQYTESKIKTLCSQFQHNLKNAAEYEQKAEQISYAVSMKKQSASKLAFVVHADPEGDSFAVLFPFNKNIIAGSLPIMYKDLQLEDQPFYDEEKQSIVLKWKRRIYTTDAVQIHQELKMMADSSACIELPLQIWKDTVAAIDNGNLNHAKFLIMDADVKKLEKQSLLPQSSETGDSQTTKCPSKEKEITEIQSEHWVDIQLHLHQGDILKIQMTSEIKRGYHMPTVQLVHIKPKFEICVDHVHSPITCFSRLADNPSRNYYKDTEEYIRIWKPLCEMESAATAVNESDSVIIENLQVKFKQEQQDILTGSFFLPLKWIREWAIDFNLAKCLLCIRKRGLKLNSNMEHSALVDPREFTWVAHGFTYNAEEKKKKEKKNDGIKVEFYVRHLPMQTIPDCVFQRNTDFTVEIIPKLLPDIRKENAVVNITSACDIVKAIALGQRILREVKSSLITVRKKLNGLPELNQSQHHAVDKALNNTFTLIQGPPGTGKTVVGVYIIYCFFEHNSKNQRKWSDPKDKGKKEVILYCGPSNKSVDVVAEYLMRFKDNLRPLRVYSQQVEMLDFPYPDCYLQFSHRTLRQDRSKPELKDITLHHRMRQDHNIYSAEIKAFDERIKRSMNKKKEELTAQEVKEYKDLLNKARAYELQQHDIILCTCTQSSNLSLTKTITARQILIDECGMATEPQALIPLVCNKPEKIVLIGDHKQLQPIVKNERVRKLGMAKSLFERYHTIHKNRAVMLDIQYRMHEDICEFPSKEFYDGKLKTGARQPNSVFEVDHKIKPFVFGDVKGKTISLIVNTAKGNENSKANHEERNTVIDIAKRLVNTARIEPQSIVILSPYNAQVSEIKNELMKKNMAEIQVTTITKSQGSEWRYVIISTVCSLPSEAIEREPEGSWLSKHLGFVGDPNQINVAITRAKEGLCIIGDQELLMCNKTWRHLLQHYHLHNAVTVADKISVRSAR